MNERIKELASVADQLAEDELVHLERVHNRLYSLTESREIYNQKFAELIVRECIGIIDEEGSHEGGSIRSMEAIKQHFGVEE